MTGSRIPFFTSFLYALNCRKKSTKELKTTIFPTHILRRVHGLLCIPKTNKVIWNLFQILSRRQRPSSALLKGGLIHVEGSENSVTPHRPSVVFTRCHVEISIISFKCSVLALLGLQHLFYFYEQIFRWRDGATLELEREK